jgi:oxygen-dependent protoporphyrinogen oxidase
VKRLVVIGGGISGMAAAFTAQKRAREASLDLDLIVLEKEREVGGKARSEHDGEWLFETGPLGWLSREAIVAELAREAGLEAEVLTAAEAQSRRFVHTRGRPREVRTSPLGFAASGILSVSGLLRVAREPWIPAKPDSADESVWDFAARRLGSEFASRLVHPMALGIFAGDARRLSLPSAFPMMAEMEREHGSLIRAQIARARGSRGPSGSKLLSFRKGMQSLPRALASRGGFTVRASCGCRSVEKGEGGYRVLLENEEVIAADAVILACEGFRAAQLLSSTAPEISRRLLEIPTPPVRLVALGYGPEAMSSIPRGFGVLIPRDAGYRALGVTCDGYLFPDRNREGHLLVRLFFGGTFDPGIDAAPVEDVERTAVSEMKRLFSFESEPRFIRSCLWPRAIPQYELGHGARVAEIERELSRFPSLYLAGNSLHGPSFGRAAARGACCGRDSVEALIRRRTKEASR